MLVRSVIMVHSVITENAKACFYPAMPILSDLTSINIAYRAESVRRTGTGEVRTIPWQVA
jgi:hypothetical protein